MSCINLDKKILFIHIPKTGGTSMEQAPFLRGLGYKHATVVQFQQIVNAIQGLEMEELWKFTFVRNPYTRFVSGILNHVIKHQQPTKKNFIKAVSEIPNFRKLEPLKPMVSYATIGNKVPFDFIGRYENIEKDWQVVCDKVGINFPLPHKLKGKAHGKDYMSYYTPKIKEMVSRAYQADFHIFNYAR